MTKAPSEASLSLIALPIPRLPPVTSAILPARLPVVFCIIVDSSLGFRTWGSRRRERSVRLAIFALFVWYREVFLIALVRTACVLNRVLTHAGFVRRSRFTRMVLEVLPRTLLAGFTERNAKVRIHRRQCAHG